MVRGPNALRRELITVIDMLALYGMQALPDLAQVKVLVVEHRDEKFGLVVGALDNIVTIDSADRIAVPAMLMRQAGKGLSNGLKEAVELPGRGTLMLLDLATVCEQVADDAVH